MKKSIDLLTLQETSRYLRVSNDALYDLARSGKIPSFKVGRSWRFRKSSINHWMEKQERSRSK